jgi:hypothetical protein
LMLLTFALISTAAAAEEWVVLQPPPESGTLPPGILVDSSSIQRFWMQEYVGQGPKWIS